MIYTHCSGNDKPGKNEIPVFFRINASIKNCPDCDRKRSAACTDPQCAKIN